MNPGQDSQDWKAHWKAQERGTTQMKSDVVCAKARALERKTVAQFPEAWIRAGWIWGAVTLIYAAARWIQVGQPLALNSAAASESCMDFLHAELAKKRARILELRWILLLLFPAQFVSWWGGGPVAVAKRLGIEWTALLQFQASPGPLIGFAMLLTFVWFKFGQEAKALQVEMDSLR